MQTKRGVPTLISRGFILGIALSLTLVLQPTASGLQTGILTGNLVVAVSGQVEIHRASWHNPNTSSRLSIGEIVQPGDLILIDPDEHVTILCADSSVIQLDSMNQVVRCQNDPAGPLITWRGGSLTNIQRRGDLRRFEQMPYLISPRNTRLLTNTPEIRWSPLADAHCYDVQLLSGGEVRWEQKRITATAVTTPPLEPGYYIVTITPNDSAGNPIDVPNDPIPQRFQILSSDESEAIQDLQNTLTTASAANGMPADVLDYQLVIYYTQQELYTDAIDTLQTLLPFNIYDTEEPAPAQTFPLETLAGSPAPYLHLGELYKAVSLPVETLTSFEVALAVALEHNDEEAIAIARAHLAQLTTVRDDAMAFYRQAIGFYDRVGDDSNSLNLRQRCLTVGSEEECAPRE